MTTRILWVNTVGWDAYDQPIADILGRIKQSGTEVEIARFGLFAMPPRVGNKVFA